MNINARRRLLVGMAAVCATAMSVPSQAQEAAYPSRPVKIVVPLAAGGITDIAARMMAARLSVRLGQPVVVENRPGPGGMIGAEYAAKAPPDGYTLIMGTVSSHAINMSFYPNLKYDNLRDFVPLGLVTVQPLMLVVHPSVPAKNLSELVQLLKTDHAKYPFGSTGVATSNHLTMVMFSLQSGVEMLHVPYKGSGPLIVDLLGGAVSAAFDNMPTALAQVRNNKLRPIAVTSAQRFPAVPDVPAIAETYPGFQVTAWQGLFAPTNTPAPIVAKLTHEIEQVLREPEIIARINEMGAIPGDLSGERFRSFVQGETERWAKAVKSSGAKPN